MWSSEEREGLEKTLVGCLHTCGEPSPTDVSPHEGVHPEGVA